MGSLRERNPSLWVATTDATTHPPLEGDRRVDVVVCGGGITGLTAALLLRREGADVLLVEAGRVAAGVTGYTTAKVTSLHGTIYSKLVSKDGRERAAAYAEANQAGLQLVLSLTEELSIDCDLERQPAYTYAASDDDLDTVKEEAEVAASLGLPATFVEQTGLPYPAAGAVRFEGQAMFHPRRYCLALAAAFVEAGGRIAERTRALSVHEDGACWVETDRGRVDAGHCVIATHLPFADAGGHFARAFPQRSYALAVRTETIPDGMYLSTGTPTRSLRPAQEGDERLLIVGGEGHKSGQEPDTTTRYEALERWARENVGATEVRYRWSAQDYSTADGIPYVGRLSGAHARTWVATGYAKWGMTNGSAAGLLLADLIGGRDSPWAEAFDATRIKPTGAGKSVVKENLNVAKRFVGDRLSALAGLPEASELSPGEGAIARLDGDRVAAFRDTDGTLRAVSPTCTHLGCLVAFNTAERTWDCPCHGSRFDTEGRVIQGPAVRNLEPKAR